MSASDNSDTRKGCVMLGTVIATTLLAALAVDLPSGTLDADPGGALSHRSAPHSFDGLAVLPALAVGLAPLRLMSSESKPDLPSTSSTDWSPKTEPADLEATKQIDEAAARRNLLRISLLFMTAILITVLILLANGILSVRRELQDSDGLGRASRPKAVADLSSASRF